MALVQATGFGPEIVAQRQRAKETTTTRSRTLPLLPSGFPLFLDSELAWSASEIRIETEHIYHLTHQDKAEIDKALVFFKGQNHSTTI